MEDELRLISAIAIILILAGSICSAANIADIKLLGNGEPVSIGGKIVTYATSSFFYIEESGRNAAIRVEMTNHGLLVGASVSISGTIRTNASGERYIEATSATANGTGEIQPLAMNTNIIGGGDWNYVNTSGAGQQGTDGGVGLNTTGLLVRTWGTLSANNSNSFYLNNTLKCVCADSVSYNPLSKFVIVTGIVSTYAENGSIKSLLIATSIESAQTGYDGEMVFIPAGSFSMGAESYGDEEPIHNVTLSTYWISASEITRAQYTKFIAAGGYSNQSYWSSDGWMWRCDSSRTQPDYWDASQTWGTPPGAFTQTDNHPVVGVTYYEAEAYCNWAGGHLPTEAQWEKAARWNQLTSTSYTYPWGNTWDASKCNNWDDSTYTGYITAPIDSYASGASSYNLYDCAANVSEWCRDWYDFDYYSQAPAVDPTGPDSGVRRSIRGGSWNGSLYSKFYLRAACRDYDDPTYSSNDLGFRIAK